MKKLAYFTAAAVAVSLASCSQSKWKLEGNVEGAAGQEVILEAANEMGGWYGLDTVTAGDDGSFSFSGDPAGHPEIYRVRIGTQSAYFPVDSIETITISGSVSNLANGYSVSGSPEADRMHTINHLLDSASRAGGETAVTDEQLKRRLANIVLGNPSGMTAYYTIFRRVGNTQLFNPAVPFDNRIIGAVANAFTEKRPADPRTKMLTQLFLQNRKRYAAPTDTLVATEIKHPEIALRDVTGKLQKLSDATDKGNVVLLNFTAYSAQEGPALNVELNKIYSAHKGQGLQIYQVGFDPDEYLWRQSAKNIPWIAVYNPSSEGDAVLMRFNVGSLPAIFIFNRNGDLVERVTDLSKLEASVAKYL